MILIMIPIIGAAAAIVSDYIIEQKGRIYTVNVEAYWDANLTIPALVQDWGDLEPAEIKQRLIYVTNTGNRPMALTVATSDWTPPEIAAYVLFHANYEAGHVITPGEVYAVGLRIEVAVDIPIGFNDFSFKIHLIGDPV